MVAKSQETEAGEQVWIFYSFSLLVFVFFRFRFYLSQSYGGKSSTKVEDEASPMKNNNTLLLINIIPILCVFKVSIVSL